MTKLITLTKVSFLPLASYQKKKKKKSGWGGMVFIFIDWLVHARLNHWHCWLPHPPEQLNLIILYQFLELMVDPIIFWYLSLLLEITHRSSQSLHQLKSRIGECGLDPRTTCTFFFFLTELNSPSLPPTPAPATGGTTGELEPPPALARTPVLGERRECKHL